MKTNYRDPDWIRSFVNSLRRTPTPLLDVIPVLQAAADEIERLQEELASALDAIVEERDK